MCGKDAPFAPGNAMPLASIPDGAEIHNIEMLPGRGGVLVRGAGTAARLMSKVCWRPGPRRTHTEHATLACNA